MFQWRGPIPHDAELHPSSQALAQAAEGAPSMADAQKMASEVNHSMP
jgi:hypothetical protein